MEDKRLCTNEVMRLVKICNGELPSIVTKGYSGLADGCFLCNDNLKSISIREGVTIIGANCFLGCCNLSAVKLPMTLKCINSYSFASCRKLEEIKIPDGVTTIMPLAFAYCTSLKHVEIGKNVRVIGAFAFSNCGFEKTFLFDSDGRLITYKAMYSNMTCMNGYQYKVGETYKKASHEEVKLCKCGFHSCLNPYSCLNYYFGDYGKDIVMCKCIAEGGIDKGEEGDKIASRKITILKKFDSYYDVFEDYNRELEKIKTTKDNC